MIRRWMKMVAWMAAAMVALSAAPAALADATMLAVDFRGLTAVAGGQWLAVPLTGEFTVEQDGAALGTITSGRADSAPMQLPSATGVTLRPVAGSWPEGYLVEDAYQAAVTGGRTNTVPVLVYADAGLFTVQADGAASFALLDEAGQTVLSFDTAADGTYALPQAMASGRYTLRQVKAVAGKLPAEDQTFDLPAYRGSADQIVALQATSVAVTAAQTSAGETASAAALTVSGEDPLAYTLSLSQASEQPMVLFLPEGWRLAPGEGVVRTADRDLTVIEPGTTQAVLTLTRVTDSTDALLMARQADQAQTAAGVQDAWSDAALSMASGIYEALDVTVQAGQAQGDEVTGRTVTGVVFDDADQSGEMTSGEVTASGAAVTITGGEVRYAALTDDAGAFRMTGVEQAAGLTLTLLPREGMTALAADGVALPDEGDVQQNLGYTSSGRVSGRVSDASSAGIAGVGVTLDGRETVTDATGLYAFDQVPDGQYTITFASEGATIPEVQAAQAVTVGGDAGRDVTVNVTAQALGTLVLEIQGETADMDYTLLSGGVTAAAGTMAKGETLRLSGLAGGEYTLVLALPEGLVMTSLNGYAAVQKGQVQWQITVTEGQESLYQVTLSRAGAVSGMVGGIPDGTQVTLSSASDVATAVVSGGSFSAENLCPGDYTVTVPLPSDANVSGENWVTTTIGGTGAAVTSIAVQGGSVSAVPTLETLQEASVSGRVTRADDGSAVAGATAALLSEDGATVASAQTDDSGAWTIGGLHGGTYILQVTVDASLALSGKSDTSVVGENGQSDAFILAEGQNLAGMDAQTVSPGTITVSAFIDGNNNGERGVYERPLAGVSVQAVRRSDTGETVVATASTGEDGTAVLPQLPAGDYVIRTTLPSGYGYGKQGKELRASSSVMTQQVDVSQDSAGVTLSAGQNLSLGVGATVMSAVTGQVWLDENADGVKDAEEVGQAGVKVEMIGTKNGLSYETTTAADGTYVLDQLKPGSYKLRVTAPDGLMFTKYTTVGRENRSVITTEGKRVGAKTLELTAGETVDKQYVGLVYDAVIEGRCFLDANYNGVYDEGEEPLPGVTLEAIKQGNGKTVASVESGEDGTFAVAALRANTYRLRVVLPDTGVTFTKVVEDGVNGNHLAARVGRRENALENLTLATGEHLQVAVGAILPGSISGTVYLDNDFSGAMESGERVVSGLTVTLLDAEGQTVATDRTSAKGKYVFEDLTPGSYRLTMEAKTGYAFTKAGEGNVMINQGSGTGLSDEFTLLNGEEKTAMDCGMILPGVVEGAVFADLNDNGVRDADEGGLTGSTVRLMGESGEFFSAQIGEDGAFRFDAVMPGRYYLRYELPEGAVFASVVSGGNTVSGDGGAGAGDWFDFATGDQVTGPVCGGLTLGEISGVAFDDPDGSGTQDAGENPMAGVTVTLTPSRADLEEISAVTGEDGAFALTGLHPDAYRLTVTFPEGSVLSRVDAVKLPLKPGENSQTADLALAMGDSWTDQRLGGVQPASLTIRAWLDENNDGHMDSGEAVPEDVRVDVVDQATGSVFTTLTPDETGVMTTGGLIPGSYTLTCALDSATIAPPEGDSTFTADGSALVMRDVVLAEGETRDGLVLGLVRYTALGGQVWLDEGGDIQALAGAEVSLMDASGSPLKSVTTGEDGRYRFDGLLPGTYYVTSTLPEGQLVVDATDTRLAETGRVSVMTQSSGRTGQSGSITVLMGEDQLALDIGSVLPGRLGDLCWLDENGNGLQDGGEGGLPGVKIEALLDGEVVAETTSDEYGAYVLENLYPAEYQLRVTMPAEVKPTKQRTDFPAIVSVLNEDDGETATADHVTVVSDKHNYDADLGFVLRTAGVYPAGYGAGQTQDWTRTVLGE